MSLSDTYREFELYLEQVNDEITQVFEGWNSSYSSETYNKEISTQKKTALIDSTRNLLQNGQWEANTSLFQSVDSVASDLKELLTKYNQQQSICDNNYNVNNALDLPNEKQMTFEYSTYPQWCSKEPNDSSSMSADSDKFYLYDNGIPINNHPLMMSSSAPSMICTSTDSGDIAEVPTVSQSGNIINENVLHAKSMDELYTLSSWLCWQQNLNIDYSHTDPLLKKVTVKVNKQTCSQLDRRLAEIEATEACKWLRAAGFPQYAQMYEDSQFPVDVAAVQHDHPLLEPAVLQSLFRRIHALNRCANVCQQPSSHPDDSEDEQCALSDNWTYQSDKKRWSRNCQTEETSNIDQLESPEKSCNANCCEDVKSSSNIAVVQQDKPELSQSLPQSEEHKWLRRAATTRFRHHREGVVVSDVSSVSSVSDILLKRLGNIKFMDESPQPELEYTTIETERQEEEEVFTDSNTQIDAAAMDKDSPVWNNVQGTDILPEENVQTQQNGRPIISLSCTQLQILRKLALLKLTAHIEKYCPSHRTGWNWELPKFIKKIRTPLYKENMLLNLPLTVVLQRTGQPLPRGIQEALEWLRLNGADQVGLFRKPGVRSRIQALKSLVENQGENINFSEQQPFDVADMIKQYFRELPEAVLTNKLSETFMLIFQYVPPFLRREAVVCTLLLMPDEHREVLQAILYFLLRIAKYKDVNQMNESNLAICFAPSLFQYSSHSSFYRQSLSSQNPRELVEIKAAQECLLYLLKNNGDIFNVPREFLNQCKLNELSDSIPVQLSDLGTSTDGGWQGYMQECHSALLKEVREKNRGWIIVSTTHPKIELSYKKVDDGHPLRLWKVCVDVEAPPAEVLHRLLRERHIWDDDLHSAKIIAQMNKHSEVFHFVRRTVAPLPYVDYCVIRTWNTDLPRGTCVIVETSVEHPDIPNIPNTVRGIVLASRYLIEPGGSGRSRLLHLSRIDMRGRMPEWYHKNYGHLCAIHAAHIQSSFRQSTGGPESKV